MSEQHHKQTLSEMEIYTDGACKGNPGPGGWGAILRFRGIEKELSGYTPLTTNNRMELQAAISALHVLKKPVKIHLYTDSQYVKKGVTEWLPQWKARGWKTADKKPVKNVDLWQDLDELCQKYTIDWHWVKGHAGHPENERADQLANQAISENLNTTHP